MHKHSLGATISVDLLKKPKTLQEALAFLNSIPREVNILGEGYEVRKTKMGNIYYGIDINGKPFALTERGVVQHAQDQWEDFISSGGDINRW